MNRIARWMIRLYPASWRARYSDEMEALLSDTGADARVVGDLARGGMRMQLRAWPFPLLAMALGVAGLLVGAGIAFLLPNVYMSRATLLAEGPQSSASVVAEMMRLQVAVLSRGRLAQIIEHADLYQNERKTEPLEDVIETMRANTHIDFAARSGGQAATAFMIQFEYRDRIKAQQAVTALVAAFQREAAAKRSEAMAGLPGEKMAVLDFPSLPSRPVSPTRLVIFLSGFLGGVIVAGIVRVFARGGWFRRRFTAIALGFGFAGMIFSLYAEAVDLPIWFNRYRSTAVFRLKTAEPGDFAAVRKEVLSLTSLAGIVNDPRLLLYRGDLKKAPLEEVVRKMRGDISVQEIGGGAVALSFYYGDRFKAQQAVAVLMAEFGRLADQRLAPPAESAAVPVIEVLDQPSGPASPVRPKRYFISAVGGVCGVFLAGIIWIARRRWRPEGVISET
jgi:hypothetical protein